MGITKWLSKLHAIVFPRTNEDSLEALQALRQRHNARCLSFKSLIAANSKALEAMSDMEAALAGTRPFDRQYIQKRSEQVFVHVHRMLTEFRYLSQDDCTELFECYDAVKKNVTRLLIKKKLNTTAQLLLPLKRVSLKDSTLVGSKVASLGEVVNKLNIRIPSGFVITAEANQIFFELNDIPSFIENQIRRSEAVTLDQLFFLSSEIHQKIMSATLPPSLSYKLEEAVSELGRKKYFSSCDSLRLALRSSSLHEDQLGKTFAGQLHSELNVDPDDIATVYKEIISSAYSPTAMSYRAAQGITDDVPMGVAVMEMVDAASGGVIYTQDPLGNHDGTLFITAALGLPSAVVNGEGETDLFLVDKEENAVLQKRIAHKEYQLISDPILGVVQKKVPLIEANKPALRDREIIKLAEMAKHIEQYFGCPQDIEFAIDQDRNVILLQCRPLEVQVRSAEVYSRLDSLDSELLYQGGVTVSSGRAAGSVYLLKKDSDVLRCPKNAILVAKQASPKWAPLLPSSRALITEQGSVAGHLGSVSRELSIPALFGVEGCMEFLKNDQIVTVDSDSCSLYQGAIVQELAPCPAPPTIMKGTPLYKLLSEVVEFISPLNLLDSQSDEFVPKSCRTLHDITRYCHELAVKQIFSVESVGADVKKMSRQLFHKVPMQYWIVDLGGGIKEESTGKFVRLEELCCVPMLKLWQGMTAKKDSPAPAVNMKGLMSVMMEAAVNPEIEIARCSDFTAKNFFLISKEFCNLQSRFGFHFCTVEGLAGEHKEANYVSFQFKGGGADIARRVQRANVISDILQEYSFRTEVKGDALFARVEGEDQEKTEQLFMILGYLLIHTRRLDMVMGDFSAVKKHRNRILQDLEALILCDEQGCQQ